MRRNLTLILWLAAVALMLAYVLLQLPQRHWNSSITAAMPGTTTPWQNQLMQQNSSSRHLSLLLTGQPLPQLRQAATLLQQQTLPGLSWYQPGVLMQQLQQQLDGHVSVFVGQSGVGKSSLVNSLLPEVDTRVGPLSELTGKGTHTTTTARLFHFPGGGELIDSPGIREFGLVHVSRDDVEAGFIEFHDLIGQCRFRDCKHDREPGCALLKALEDGRLHPQRMASYRHILASLPEAEY